MIVKGVPYETQGGGESGGTKSMRGLEPRCYGMNRTWGMRPQGYGKGQWGSRWGCLREDGDRVTCEACEGQTMPASLNTRVDQTIKFSLS